MRGRLGSFVLGAILLAAPAVSKAQMPGGGMTTSYAYSSRAGVPLTGPVVTTGAYGLGGTSVYASPYYRAPGNYGVAYGYPSYGSPRTYSSFSSPYGAGYGYGLEPYGYMSNRYGVGLWRPGYSVPGYAYRSSYYWTFAPAPIRPPVAAPFPPLGYYAPGFGPPSFYGW